MRFAAEPLAGWRYRRFLHLRKCPSAFGSSCPLKPRLKGTSAPARPAYALHLSRAACYCVSTGLGPPSGSPRPVSRPAQPAGAKPHAAVGPPGSLNLNSQLSTLNHLCTILVPFVRDLLLCGCAHTGIQHHVKVVEHFGRWLKGRCVRRGGVKLTQITAVLNRDPLNPADWEEMTPIESIANRHARGESFAPDLIAALHDHLKRAK